MTRPAAGRARSTRGSPTSICATIPRGPHDELWQHSAGCRHWFTRAARHAHARHPRQRAPGERLPEPRDDAAVSPRRRRRRRPRAAARVHVRRRALRGLSPATRSPRRCSPTACTSSRAASSITGRAASSAPAARSPTRWCSSRAARAPSPTCARRRRALRRPRRREPEPLAVARASTSARSTTSLSRAPARGLLLQDVHVAADAAVVAALRARRSAAPPAWAARATRARSRPLRASVRALRRARRRRRPAGLAAARAAARAGARVIVCDEDPRLGGSLSATTRRSTATARWRGSPARRASSPRIRTSRCCRAPPPSATTTTTSSACSSASTDHLRSAAAARAARSACGRSAPGTIVLATGAHERGIAFANNDLPGTMLAGAARTYVKRYARAARARARWSSRTTTAPTRRRSRCATPASPSPRSSTRGPTRQLDGALPQQARDARHADHCRRPRSPARTAASASAPSTSRRSAAAPTQRLDCDLVCVSGGWNPAVHLFSQARGKLRYDDALAAFVPESSPLPIVAGGRRERPLRSCRRARRRPRGRARAPHAPAGVAPTLRRAADARRRSRSARCSALWSVPARARGDKRFVDLQNDVTVDDIALAAREGYHVGRASQALHDARHGHRPGQDGQHRRPRAARRSHRTLDLRGRHDDVPAAVHAGHARRVSRARECGAHVEPTRYSAMHDWHVEHGARFVNAGLWKRPHSYPRAGESPDDAANREAKNVRANVGVVDVSTLGKIELQGRDVAEFLNRVYINRWDTLAVGRCRYGVMLRDDGMVLDDGTTSRLGADALPDDDDDRQRGQGDAASRMPAAGRLAGARGLRHVGHRAMGGGGAVGPEGARRARAASSTSTCRTRRSRSSPSANATFARRGGPIPARLFRMSYSGELAYEIHVPARSRPRDVGSGDRGGRAVRHHAVRHRGDEHAAHRKGPRRRRRRGRRPHDRRRPRAWASSSAPRSGASASRCSTRPALTAPRSLAAGRPHRARRRGDAARGEDRRRSRSRVAEPDAGPRDVVVLEPEPRRVDRAGAGRERPRAARRNAVGGLAARRCEGARARSARRASSIPKASGCVADRRRRDRRLATPATTAPRARRR